MLCTTDTVSFNIYICAGYNTIKKNDQPLGPFI